MLADDFCGAVAFDALGSRVPARHPPLRIEHEDRAILHALNQQPEALLALAQGLLGALALGNVADHTEHEHALARLERAQHNVDRELRAVLAPAVEREPRAHGPHARLCMIMLAMRSVRGPEALRRQEFHGLAQQLFPPVAEHAFGLAVDAHDSAFSVGKHNPVRGRFEEPFEEAGVCESAADRNVGHRFTKVSKKGGAANRPI